MNDDLIVFEHVVKRYGNKNALNDLSFSVKRGEFFGYLGPNGAGKTTSIKAMMGLIRPEGGRVVINGIDPVLDPIAIRSIVGFVPDSPFIYVKLSGREFLRFVGGLFHMLPDDIEKGIAWLADIFEMHGWLDLRTEEYSHGMKQKVVMSAAFIHHPELIIVDEPTVGLDPPSARLLKDMLLLIQKSGTTVFMSSHDLSIVQELCNHMVIIHEGRVLADGTLDDLRVQAEIEGGNLESLFMKLTGKDLRTAYLDSNGNGLQC
jgi:ABC-2 type transport system ATP-binding protein